MYEVRKISSNGTSLIIALPRKMLAEAGLELGNYVQLQIDDRKHIIISPLSPTVTKYAKRASSRR